MPISYFEVEEYVEKIRPHIESSLKLLEDRLRKARDRNGIPIHLMKWRVKSIDSAYLKTKRKSKTSLSDITDIGGFRILCMFEQDIFPIHEHLVKLLKDDGFSMSEFRIFNWHDESAILNLETEVKRQFADHSDGKRDNKDSGYRSLHYVVNQGRGGHQCSIEIQLRTLLQDAWAELEHAISYKHGSIHPHIRKSFSLLARDLETNDMLIKHLRDIDEKERYIEAFSLENVGPYSVFWYEGHMIPDLFRTNTELKSCLDEYEKWVRTDRTGQSDLREWASSAREIFQRITSKISVSDLEIPEVKYWIDAEKAFLHFCSGELDPALDIYEALIKRYPHHYVAHFRKGEIEFIRGNTEKCLVSFDQSEEAMDSQEQPDVLNSYRLKVKLANIYWFMGSEYFGIALTKTKEAEKIMMEHSSLLQESDRRKLANNCCWYQMEIYLLAQEKYLRSKTEDDRQAADREYDETASRYEVLKQILDDKASSNMFDTAAWFCFRTFQRDGNKAFLDMAKAYCKEGWGRKNEAMRSITSLNMHGNHTREIMSTKAPKE